MKPSDFDKETLGLMYGYAGRDLFNPREVKETVLNAWGDESWTFDEFREILDEVPAKYRAAARIEFDTGYGDSSGHVEVWYPRTETEAEVAERVNRASDYARSHQSEERAQYQRLKEKFKD